MFVVSTEFLIGLHAYVRQAALSIDRTGSDFRDVLREYYDQTDTPSPEQVDEAFAKHCKPESLPIAAVFNRKEKILANGVIESAQRLIQALCRMLYDNDEWTDEEKVALRLELSRLESHLRAKLPKRAVDAASRVEHYNQNRILKTESLTKIVGDTWLT